MDNMLEMYLYETNTLLEQLDELLIEAEKNEDFTTNDVNEIFPHHAYDQRFLCYDGILSFDGDRASYRGLVLLYSRKWT